MICMLDSAVSQFANDKTSGLTVAGLSIKKTKPSRRMVSSQTVKELYLATEIVAGSVGELEGAKPASIWIKCPGLPAVQAVQRAKRALLQRQAVVKVTALGSLSKKPVGFFDRLRRNHPDGWFRLFKRN